MEGSGDSSISLDEVRVKQEPECVFNEHMQVKEEEELTKHVKEEVAVEWEDSVAVHGVSDAAVANLYAGHEVKDELVLGPEGLQPADIAFTFRAAHASDIKEQSALRDCVVRLERIHNLEALLSTNPCRSTAGQAASLLKQGHTSEQEESGSDDGTETEDAPIRKRRKNRSYATATPERIEHRANLTAILRFSNASPFRNKNTRGFCCLYCRKHFQNIRELRAHTARQSEKNKLESMLDFTLSKNPIKLDITELECNVCHAAMSDLNGLKDHLASVHNKRIYKNIKDIILPFRLGDGDNFTCVICSVTHVSYKSLYRHMTSHYTNYLCNRCGIGCITITALRYHNITHEQGNFPCAYCDKTHSSLIKKNNHEKVVHKCWLRNKCPHCPEMFLNYSARNVHLAKSHNETPFRYPCHACDKIYKRGFELNRHIKHTHLRQRNFFCNTCHAGFISKRSLAGHMKTHGGQRHSCHICAKTYARSNTLKEHILSHDDDKRLQCEICRKTFAQKRSLEKHTCSHQDRLEDDVEHVDDTSRPGQGHVSKHAGGETHICEICPKTFARARNLKEHMNYHDADKRLQCEICKKTFVQKRSLKNHMRSHQHPDDREMTLKQIAEYYENKKAEERIKQKITQGLNISIPSIQYKRY